METIFLISHFPPVDGCLVAIAIHDGGFPSCPGRVHWLVVSVTVAFFFILSPLLQSRSLFSRSSADKNQNGTSLALGT